MGTPRTVTVDGNEAAASIAYRLSEVAAIYPITPSSPMGELADEWAAHERANVFGGVPRIVEMQSEGGAAGAVHGALQAGALATTFTASQGLLLMIPTMYKVAGELLPFVMHVAARTVATHALSIFGDHSDVMACRQTGFAMLCSATVQEAHDLACVAHLATWRSRVPFVHFFDGFRTSHELRKITLVDDDDLRALVDDDAIAAIRERALTPDRPVLRGSAQNPDVFFQAREACNPFHAACADVVAEAMAAFAARTGRSYRPFDYCGDPAAERVVVVMGSAAEAVREAVQRLRAGGERVGMLQVRLYRPFSVEHLLAALPSTARRVAVLDRTKEPGAAAEPLCLDVIAAVRGLVEPPLVVGGRYGLSGKEFTPAMAASVFAELQRDAPRHGFTVGIVDDVTHHSLPLPADDDEPAAAGERSEAVFFGLGADGTVGANKSSIKILGAADDRHVQGFFVYDSKKSGAMTVSHLRFGHAPFEAPYLIRRAGFVACHQFSFLDRVDVLACAAHGATLLLNAPFAPDRVWHELPGEVQQQVRDKALRVFTIDAGAVAREAGIGGRVNTIMQVCYFELSGVMPRAEAIAAIKAMIAKTYRKKGDEVVRRNHRAVDAALAHLHEVVVPADGQPRRMRPPIVPPEAPEFVQRVTAAMLAGAGESLPCSAFPPDGTWPTGTARWEKRSIAAEVPVWDADVCIQCNKCALMCPHAAIRAKVYEPAALDEGAELPSQAWRGEPFVGHRYTIQVAPDDCTGCGLCVQVCPAKDKANPRHKAIDMTPVLAVQQRERARFAAFERLPELDPAQLDKLDVRGSQLLQPLFEYSGACAGCGETSYVKLLTQLFGDRLLIANATGCSSIYGGNLPTTPYTKDAHGRGPAWANSLFEDNAEFGLGMRLSVDVLAARARQLLVELAPELESVELAGSLISLPRTRDARWLQTQRGEVEELRRRLSTCAAPAARELERLADYLVPKSVWLVGGDGWAFDIGYGGLDHVLASPHDVNVLVLDTEVYSNTGGQASKATPLGAAAKFAAKGKAVDKKDLGLMALHYGHVFVASVAIGAQDAHTVRVLREAEAHPGPSLVIAYSPCIAHGYDLVFGGDQQKRAVQSGVWPLFRYDPAAGERGEPPLVVDAPGDRLPVADYMRNEARFRMVEQIDPQGFRRYAKGAQQAAERRMAVYRHIAALRFPDAVAASQHGREAEE